MPEPSYSMMQRVNPAYLCNPVVLVGCQFGYYRLPTLLAVPSGFVPSGIG